MARPEAISDADAQAAYAANIGRYGSPERRTIQQVVFPDAAGAEAARRAIEDGSKTFEAVADARGTDGKDLTLGTLTRAELFDRAVADAAFALPEGGVSQPVQGRFGTVLLRVTRIEPGSVRPFPEVEPEIRKALALSRARDGMESARDAIEDQRSAAKPLADIAAERGLRLVALKSVDAQGRTGDGQRAADIPDPDTTLPALFRAEVGGDNEPLRTKSGGYVWYDVTGIDPAHDRPLDAVRDGVKAGWTAAEVAKRLQAKGRDFVARLDRGETIEALAREAGIDPQDAQDMARNQTKDSLSADAVNLIFATQVGKAGSAAQGEARAVFKVTGASMPAYVAGGPSDKTIGQSFQAALADDVLSEYIGEVQKNAGVTIDQAALRRALGGEF